MASGSAEVKQRTRWDRQGENLEQKLRRRAAAAAGQRPDRKAETERRKAKGPMASGSAEVKRHTRRDRQGEHLRQKFRRRAAAKAGQRPDRKAETERRKAKGPRAVRVRPDRMEESKPQTEQRWQRRQAAAAAKTAAKSHSSAAAKEETTKQLQAAAAKAEAKTEAAAPEASRQSSGEQQQHLRRRQRSRGEQQQQQQQQQQPLLRLQKKRPEAAAAAKTEAEQQKRVFDEANWAALKAAKFARRRRGARPWPGDDLMSSEE